ncbi:splicing factor ESS-2 homolog [Epargyreus clarus]|uniref:splicing factor ESS-2 homolog n=1 Tax=Epargyreus clarus TaxID=520877 RepID=UPI003C2B8062
MSEEHKDSRPGEAALRNMQVLKHESSVFKVPKVPKKRILKKAQVLDEEEYVQGIAKIIQRDFFPDLEKLKAQNDFLEASENKDYAKLREITRKYSGSRPPTEPFNSPATFDTPGVDRPYSPTSSEVEDSESVIDTDAGDKTKDITDKHTLDSFLATHTSEDNASYDKLIALEDKKRAGKLASQFEAEITSNALADAALALPSIEQQADQRERPQEVDTWRYRARNYIMYVPDGVSQRAAARPALRRRNTRLRALPFDHDKNKEQISAIAREQDASIAGKIGVDGSSVCARELLPPASPRPGAGPDASPLMTWGEIEGTPFRLDGGDTPLPAVGAGAAYRMLEAGARERLALRLAERAAKRRRAATPRTPLASPHTFRTNTERLASMSPAARKLAAKHLLSPRLKMTPNAMGIVPHTPKTPPIPQKPLVATPKTKNPKTVAPTGGETPPTVDNLTDNLLQINVAKRTRLKAQDFFN